MGHCDYIKTHEWEQRASQLCIDYALNGNTMIGETCLDELIQYTNGIVQQARSNMNASVAKVEQAVKDKDFEAYNKHLTHSRSLFEDLQIKQADLYSYQEMQCALLWNKEREAKLHAEILLKAKRIQEHELDDLERMELGMSNAMIPD